MIQLRAVSLVFVALLLFGAGWAIGELRHANREQSNREWLKSCNELATSTAAMADKTLEHAASCQETLSICLRHLGFKNPSTQRTPQP